mgnify:CR=1 FL=1
MSGRHAEASGLAFGKSESEEKGIIMDSIEEERAGALTPGMVIPAEGFEFEVDRAREVADAIFETGQGMTVSQRLEAAGALATAAVYAGDCAEEFSKAWNAAAEEGGMPSWQDVPAEAKTAILVEVGLEHFDADMADAAAAFASRIAPSIAAWKAGLDAGEGGAFPLSRYGAAF